MITSVSLALALSLTSPIDGDQHDWPQWRGPQRDGTSRETNWASQGASENMWSRELGLGYSNVVIADGRLITLGYDEEAEEDVIWCLDAVTGEVLWTERHAAPPLSNFHGGGTLSTATIDDDVVYTLNRYGKSFCRRVADGTVVWEHDYQAELELEPTFHGFCASPLLADERLYLTMGGLTAAVNKEDGEVVWQSKDYGDGSYTNAAPMMLGDREALAVMAGPGLVVMDRATGEELRFHPWKPEGGGCTIATPIVMGERVFISTAYDLGSALLDMSGGEIETVWHTRRYRNKIGDTILHEGHLYGFDESMLKCIDLDGKERWRQRGLGMGTLSRADDRLIILSSKGELIVAEANPDAFTELSRERVLEGGVYWTTPVISNGLIYCRNSLGHLVCRDHRPVDRQLADADDAGVGTLPSAADLFARHVDAIGGAAAWRGHESMHIEGAIEITGAGITRTPLTMDLMAPDKWHLTYPITMAGPAYRGYDGEIGWQLDPFYGNFIYEGDQLREASETRRFHFSLEYEDTYTSMTTTGATTFAERTCWVVETTTSGGGSRTLYLDRETGLLAGHEGPTESLVVYADYAAFDDVMLPTLTTVLIPDTGAEESYFTNEVTFDQVDPAVFARSDAVLRLLRTPEEIEATNAAARAQFAKYLGDYIANFDAFEDVPWSIVIEDGSLALAIPGQGAIPLLAPDENGVAMFAQIAGVSVTFLFDDDDAITGLRFDAGGQVNELPRAEVGE